jgi:hypothetical protein
MIVIATNNGKRNLFELLENLKEFSFGRKVCIIDTGSTDPESIDYLKELKEDNSYNFEIEIHQTPYKGYDTGAYIYAINNIKAERYYFFQDSLRIKNKNFFNLIDKKLSPGKVVPLITFEGNLYDYPEQVEFCIKNFGSFEFERGIFGPMFSILSEDALKIDKKFLVYPTNKSLQMGMERGWAVIFRKYNFKVDSLEGDYDFTKLISDRYVNFKKIIQYRA